MSRGALECIYEEVGNHLACWEMRSDKGPVRVTTEYEVNLFWILSELLRQAAQIKHHEPIERDVIR
jgi:hypothetical protein